MPRLWQGSPGPLYKSLRGITKEDVVTDQERSWLLRELPTYSFDNINEIAYFGRRSAAIPTTPTRHLPAWPRLTPPHHYDLLGVFDRLVDRYLIWSSGKVCVHEGRMEELHELGLRFPVGHLVRHAHARATTRGALSVQKVLGLPELISLLPSNSFGLRTVIKRGLSEGHLHLYSMLTSESSWTDYALKDFSGSALRHYSNLERRLVVFSRHAGRTLALATLFAMRCDEPPPEAFRLLTALDAMYFAQSPEKMRDAKSLWNKNFQELWRVVDSDAKGNEEATQRYLCQLAVEAWSTEEGGEPDWLLRWIDPTIYRLQNLMRTGGGLPRRRETIHIREEFVSHLHLFAHIELVRSSRNMNQRPYAHSLLNSSFFRYLICRTHHWQSGIQQGQTTGLQHFRRYYESNQRWMVGASKREEAHWVIKRAGEWRGLRVLEGRVSPPKSQRDLLPWLEAFARQRSGQVGRDVFQGSERLKKFGFVIHFIKEYVSDSRSEVHDFGYVLGAIQSTAEKNET